MRKRLLLAIAVLVALGVASAFPALWTMRSSSGITKANAAKIQRGMTSGEVEQLLGCPPGNYRTGTVKLDWRVQSTALEDVIYADHGQFHLEYWEGNAGSLWVCFDDEREVVESEFTPAKRPGAGFMDHFWEWLGL